MNNQPPTSSPSGECEGAHREQPDIQCYIDDVPCFRLPPGMRSKAAALQFDIGVFLQNPKLRYFLRPAVQEEKTRRTRINGKPVGPVYCMLYSPRWGKAAKLTFSLPSKAPLGADDIPECRASKAKLVALVLANVDIPDDPIARTTFVSQAIADIYESNGYN